ncbi:hypothetical protein VTK73DRAFT_181 [Phialemonium thermophilum]|uniref:Amino acid permease/ SLC12A domain-containing protein n=1 Tax=Phialemonium thermophilum TaxID=223376 RepID=A0ABR3XGB1_9PEZI
MAPAKTASTPGTGSPRSSSEEKSMAAVHLESSTDAQDGEALIIPETEGLHRKLTNRRVQLTAVGSSIGTALFLSIGGVLNKTGPGSLFLGFAFYNIFLALFNNCVAEMVTYMPISGSFVRLAGHWADDALSVAVGWNFYIYSGFIVPFEITALSFVLSYWSDDIPLAAICAGCIVLYILIQVFAVTIYGEVEFWLTSSKCTLIVGLLFFTFITMVGGNPKHDAFGFRTWKDPGAFESYVGGGFKFEGFLAALWSAAFTCVGPEYVSMIAAEAKHPRTYIKTAFKLVYIRQIIFFLGGSLAVGILVPWNHPTLMAIYREGTRSASSAAASPYIIAMTDLGVKVFPNIVTAMIAACIFSAGNCNAFVATRSLYGLAQEGRAPAFLKKCTKKGIPIYAFGVTMIFPCLSFLQLSSGSATVLNWLINICTGASLVTYICICITYLSFYRACKAQNFDRTKLPYCGWFQPWSVYLPLGLEIIIILCYGYTTLKPFDKAGFITYYVEPMVVVAVFFGWKFIKGTKWKAPKEVDLVWMAPAITMYEETSDDPPVGFLRDCYLGVRSIFKRSPKKNKSEV